MQLLADQQQAVKDFMSWMENPNETEALLTGPSGMGKSTTIEHMIKAANNKGLFKANLLGNNYINLDVRYTALTNKAAKVLHSMLPEGSEQVSTIHSLLGLKVVNDYKTGKERLKRTRQSTVTENSLIIVDEYSQCNEQLYKLLKDLTHNCKILFCGDSEQLNPVRCTYSPITESVKTVFKLHIPKRQNPNSSIYKLGNVLRDTVKTGIFPEFETIDNEVQLIGGKFFEQKAVALFSSDKYKQDPNIAKIICYKNTTVNSYNAHIRKLIGLPKEFVIGDIVITNTPLINTTNNKYAPTDSTLEITNIEDELLNDEPGQKITLDSTFVVFQFNNPNYRNYYLKELYRESKLIGDWATYFQAKEYIGDLRPAYAITAFKAQGSTYETTFVDLGDIGKCTQKDVTARQLYVGCTRPSKELYLFGQLPRRYYE